MSVVRSSLVITGTESWVSCNGTWPSQRHITKKSKWLLLSTITALQVFVEMYRAPTHTTWPIDGQALYGARSSAGTVMVSKFDMLTSSKLLWPLVIKYIYILFKRYYLKKPSRSHEISAKCPQYGNNETGWEKPKPIKNTIATAIIYSYD